MRIFGITLSCTKLTAGGSVWCTIVFLLFTSTAFSQAGFYSSGGSAVDTSTVKLTVPFHSDVTTNLTMNNQADSTKEFIAARDANITKVDLTNFRQVRLLVRVVAQSASSKSPRMYVQYKTAFSTTVGDYLDISDTEVSCSLSATGFVDSGWKDIVAGAKSDVFLTVIQNGGNLVADPAVGMVSVQFR